MPGNTDPNGEESEKDKPGRGDNGIGESGKDTPKVEEPEREQSDKEELEDIEPENGNVTNDGDGSVPTIEEYLKKLICTGCGRHCSLFAPQCGKGVNRAKAAKTEYYESYGENQNF